MTTQPLKILCVEDNPTDMLQQKHTLRQSRQFFDIEHPDTLEGALARLEEGHFDAILLDLSLPDSHGIETVRRMRRATHLPIVVLSGWTTKTRASELCRKGPRII